MPFLFNREVDRYVVEAFESSLLGYDRAIRLTLKPSASGDPAHTVSIEFPPTRPADFVDIGASFSTVRMSAGSFERMYHLLQTESPILFTAYEFTIGGFVQGFAGLSTDAEATGEGFRDANTLATP